MNRVRVKVTVGFQDSNGFIWGWYDLVGFKQLPVQRKGVWWVVIAREYEENKEKVQGDS